MSQTHSVAVPTQGLAVRQSSGVLPAIAAILLGLFVVGMVGFAQIDVVHNAAHDVRHSNGFPCH